MIINASSMYPYLKSICGVAVSNRTDFFSIQFIYFKLHHYNICRDYD